MSAMNPPDSPPKQPVIPEGLATKLGKYGTPVFFLIGCLVYALDLQVDWQAMALAGAAAVTMWTTMFGRYMQASAIYRDAPSPVRIERTGAVSTEASPAAASAAELAPEGLGAATAAVPVGTAVAIETHPDHPSNDLDLGVAEPEAAAMATPPMAGEPAAAAMDGGMAEPAQAIPALEEDDDDDLEQLIGTIDEQLAEEDVLAGEETLDEDEEDELDGLDEDLDDDLAAAEAGEAADLQDAELDEEAESELIPPEDIVAARELEDDLATIEDEDLVFDDEDMGEEDAPDTQPGNVDLSVSKPVDFRG